MSWRRNSTASRTSGRTRWLRRSVIAALTIGTLLASLHGLHGVESRFIYARPHPDTTFSPEPAELIAIPYSENQQAAHALFMPARDALPTVAFFHGNGHQLSAVVPRLDALSQLGVGAFVVEYPGYGLSATQEPSEDALYRHADFALRHLRDVLGVPASRTLLAGESLGTGVAVEMATRGFGARLILLSPFSSLADVARFHAPWLPAHWLLHDRYDSAQKAPAVDIPVLIVHGDADALIPASMGRNLAELFPHAEFVALQGVGHGAMIDRHADRVIHHARTWLSH